MKIKDWNDDYILFTDGSTISYDHIQDCCECNWADFSVLEVFYKDEEFDDFEVIPVEEYGFLLELKQRNTKSWFHYDYTPAKRILIPCYSDQNGYYSSDLTIIIRGPEREPKNIDLNCEVRLC
mgnify:CR=1 FL=1